jgi:transcription elongation GreA/GreB family factor
VKKELLAKVVSTLQEEYETVSAAAKAAIHAATAEESQPENQYDTFALEASYLAAAQGRRVQELERMIQVLTNFPLAPANVVGSGALLELESDGKEFYYFLLPFGAGVSLEVGGKKATVVTLDSPLGQLFQGKKAGDTVEFARGGAVKEYEILSLS